MQLSNNKHKYVSDSALVIFVSRRGMTRRQAKESVEAVFHQQEAGDGDVDAVANGAQAAPGLQVERVAVWVLQLRRRHRHAVLHSLAMTAH